MTTVSTTLPLMESMRVDCQINYTETLSAPSFLPVSNALARMDRLMHFPASNNKYTAIAHCVENGPSLPSHDLADSCRCHDLPRRTPILPSKCTPAQHPAVGMRTGMPPYVLTDHQRLALMHSSLIEAMP